MPFAERVAPIRQAKSTQHPFLVGRDPACGLSRKICEIRVLDITERRRSHQRKRGGRPNAVQESGVVAVSQQAVVSIQIDPATAAARIVKSKSPKRNGGSRGEAQLIAGTALSAKGWTYPLESMCQKQVAFPSPNIVAPAPALLVEQ